MTITCINVHWFGLCEGNLFTGVQYCVLLTFIFTIVYSTYIEESL